MTDELDVALHDLYPVPPEDPAALRRVRTRVLAGARPRRGWRTHLPVAAAAAVLAVAAAVAVVVHRTGPGGALVEVAQTLDTAADAQIRAVDPPVAAGRYRYVATHAMDAVYGSQVTVLAGTRREMWVPADLTGEWFLLRTDTGERTLLAGSADPAAVAVRSAPERVQGPCGAFYLKSVDLCATGGNWQDPTAAFIAGLPRDPDRLYDRLRADTKGRGPGPDQEVLVYVADALRSGLLPADLRAALYRALTHLPTLQITERTATLDGHTGTAFGITAAGQQQEIVIDPATGAFIGERRRTAEAQEGIAAGTVIGSSSVRYAVVARPWLRPAS